MLAMRFRSDIAARPDAAEAMDRTAPPELMIVPHLYAHRSRGGNLVLTRKFLEGAALFAEHWPGRVTVAVPTAAEPDNNLDHEEILPGRWPFEVVERPADMRAWAPRMRQARLVLLTESLLREPIDMRGVRHVVVTEYTLRTRNQITCSDVRNPLRRAKRMVGATVRQWLLDRRIVHAAGVQANGYPTYNTCRRLNGNTMLFFDSRVNREDVIDAAALDRRLAELRRRQRLRLIFSGRLIRMKGVDDLPEVAHALRRLGVAFEMQICGDGDRAAAIKSRVRQLSLEDVVTLPGVLDFRTQLLPRVRERSDLFVCPHPQGDPACTYLETMACGVPIVGYANEAWADLARSSEAGWSTPMRRPALLAARIAELHHDRELLADASDRARAFALRHTFEQTFERRMDHMLKCAGLKRTAGATAER